MNIKNRISERPLDKATENKTENQTEPPSTEMQMHSGRPIDLTRTEL